MPAISRRKSCERTWPGAEFRKGSRYHGQGYLTLRWGRSPRSRMISRVLKRRRIEVVIYSDPTAYTAPSSNTNNPDL